MILLRPVDKKWPLTQLFGENPALYPATKGHNGIDWGVPEGTPIYATAPGQIVRAELDTETAQNPKSGYGIHVRIQHEGFLSIYGHMSEVRCKTGQLVQAGDVIGISGNTGRSTGPHLHFEVRTGIACTNAIDPMPYIVDAVMAGLFVAEITPDGDTLAIRTGPTIKNGLIRRVKTGDKLTVLGFGGTDVWLRTSEGYMKYQPEWWKLL